MAETGFYIWLAYGLTGLVLGGITLASLLRYFRLKKQSRNHDA